MSSATRSERIRVGMQIGGDVFVPPLYRDRVGYSLRAPQPVIKSSEHLQIEEKPSQHPPRDANAGD
jgi:hypothetical protein